MFAMLDARPDNGCKEREAGGMRLECDDQYKPSQALKASLATQALLKGLCGHMDAMFYRLGIAARRLGLGFGLLAKHSASPPRSRQRLHHTDCTVMIPSH